MAVFARPDGADSCHVMSCFNLILDCIPNWQCLQDLMEQTFYDCSTDGGSESGEASIGGSDGRGEFVERREGGGREEEGEHPLPDSSHGGREGRRKKRGQHHQVREMVGEQLSSRVV